MEEKCNTTPEEPVVITQSENRQVKGQRIGKEFIYFSILSLCFGLMFMFSFHDFDENINGIVYPIFVIALFVFTIIGFKKLNIAIIKSSYYYVITAILLGISSFTTMNFFILFYNTIGIIILYGVFILKNYYTQRTFGPIQYVIHLFGIFFESVSNVSLPFRHLIVYQKPKKLSKRKVIPVVRGIILGIIFLCIVIPLLASSDLIFANIMGKILPKLSVPFVDEWFAYIILTMIGSFLFYGLLCTVSEKEEKVISKEKEKLEPISTLIMTWFVTVVYVLFCIIQIIFLIGGNFFELPGGITYAEYARSGFFQLVAVVTLNMLLVLISVSKVKEHKYLDLSLKIISGCTFIMIASATYRMILYIDAYHLTFLRLLVLWFLVVLTLCMIGNVYYIHHKNFNIYRYMFITGLFCYIIFAFMKPDYIIAKYNINHMNKIQIQDLDYLMMLSVDAAPAIAEIKEEQFSDGIIDGIHYEKASDRLNNYFSYINKSHNNSIRNFNISRYIAYKTAKEYLK